MPLLFRLATIVVNALGDYVVDRRGYWRSMAVIFVAVTLSLLSLSLLAPVAGSSSAAVGTALVAWSVAG